MAKAKIALVTVSIAGNKAYIGTTPEKAKSIVKALRGTKSITATARTVQRKARKR
jgi:hypothetical protein